MTDIIRRSPQDTEATIYLTNHPDDEEMNKAARRFTDRHLITRECRSRMRMTGETWAQATDEVVYKKERTGDVYIGNLWSKIKIAAWERATAPKGRSK
jgi:hypothetical protein